MGFLFCIFLIVLGVMAAGSLVGEKVPAARPAIAKLLENQEILGVIGIVIGLLSLFFWLISLQYLFAFPVRMLLALAAVLLELGLGLIFGLNLLNKTVFKDPAQPLRVQMEMARARILGKQREMGVAAMIVGVFYLLVSII